MYGVLGPIKDSLDISWYRMPANNDAASMPRVERFDTQLSHRDAVGRSCKL